MACAAAESGQAGARVAEVLADPVEARRRATKPRETVLRFSLETTVEETIAVYRDVLAERARRDS